MTQDPALERRRMRKLPFMVAAMAMNSVFTTLTVFGSVFPLFLADLGLQKAGIGVVLALIPYATLISPVMATFVPKWGYRRTFLIVWTARKFVIALMLLAPLVAARFGPGAAFAWVTACVIVFALCRATGDTGLLPWTQELVPNDIRGKYMAVESVVVTIGQIVIVAAAGFMIDHLSGPARYTAPMALGVAGGLLGVFFFSRLPGGAPTRDRIDLRAHLRELRLAWTDRTFLSFMGILSLVALGSAMASSFIPLYAHEQIGLTPGSVVQLSIGASVGSLISSLPVGWAADRIGSKPLMLIGLAWIIALPLCWLAVPHNSPSSQWFALAISFAGGVGGVAWSMGASRYLFNTAVPARHAPAYLSTYYAWSSFLNGSGPLLAGALLTATASHVADPYAVLFAVSLVPMLIGLVVLSRLRDADAVPLRRLAARALRRAHIRR